MTTYHAVMLDETGCEFGVKLTARSRAKAYEILREDYPESRVDQLETVAQAHRREERLYQQIKRAYDEGFDY